MHTTTTSTTRVAPRRSLGVRTATALGALVLLAAACGDDDDPDAAATTGGSATTVAASAATPTTAAASATTGAATTEVPATSAAPASSTAGGGAEEEGPLLVIGDFTFGELVAAAGDEITVRNQDGFAHTVTDEDGAFDVRVDGGQDATFTVDAPGTYSIFCKIHPQMQSEITIG